MFIGVDGPAEGVAVLTIRRADKKNALSNEVRDEMSAALDGLAGDEDLKTLIVTGQGDVFSAGFDLSEFDRMGEPGFADTWMRSSDRWHRTVIQFPLPTIAAVNGPALAGGFDLAVMCDIRVAADTARFAHPEQTFSDVVYGPLHDLVGGAVARDLCMTGRPVSASEALGLRLVTAVVPAGQVVDEAHRLAALVTRAPREVLVRTKAKAVRRAGVAGTTLDL
ncbi:MAG: enoyl-CoA hydratase [Actinomycetota bacterium]